MANKRFLLFRVSAASTTRRLDGSLLPASNIHCCSSLLRIRWMRGCTQANRGTGKAVLCTEVLSWYGLAIYYFTSKRHHKIAIRISLIDGLNDFIGRTGGRAGGMPFRRKHASAMDRQHALACIFDSCSSPSSIHHRCFIVCMFV